MTLSIIENKAIKKQNNFIAKSIKRHGDRFDYSKAVFVDSRTKVEIICPIHLSYWQEPASHIRGRGCPVCGKESSQKTRSLNTKFFIEKSIEIHGNIYNYDKSEYINYFKPIILTCGIHGDWTTKPVIHLGGSLCPKCAIESKDVFNYGGFGMTAWLNYCQNNNIEKALCYIIRLFNEKESFIKIGITTSFKTRMYHIPYDYEIIHFIEDTPEIVFKKEKILHKKFKNFKYRPKEIFGGQQECFNLNIYS